MLSLEALFDWDIDYEAEAIFMLDTIDNEIEKAMEAIRKNCNGDVDGVRAEVVARTLKDLEIEGTRMSRLEAHALQNLYYQSYDAPLPSFSSLS